MRVRVVDKSGLDNEIVTHANGHDWRRERERERENCLMSMSTAKWLR